MDEKLLQHVGYYGHIYEFVCGNSRTLDEIKDYLVQIGENTSTVKTHMQMLSGDNPGMFRVNGNMVSVDSVMARELVGEVNKIFEPLLLTETEKSAELRNLSEENEKLKRQLESYKKKAGETKKLDKKRIEASKLVFPKVLIIDSSVSDKAFPGLFLCVNTAISKFGTMTIIPFLLCLRTTDSVRFILITPSY